ncbi:hypothetical protein N0V90_009772 [Kalmusia sp. IMI 367209]|nr:hypothetical protein N0V90_009772 [Kalmusia sp. IMI 367209]
MSSEISATLAFFLICISALAQYALAQYSRYQDIVSVKLMAHAIDSKYQCLKKLSREAGCAPVKHLPNSFCLPFGLDKFIKYRDAEYGHRLPLLCLEDHELHGDTYAQFAGGSYIVFTREPLNLRAALSSQFQDFELGEVRQGIMAPLLGAGIFTNDGARWDHSRRLLAPMFHQPEIPSLRILEKYVEIMLQQMSPHGSAKSSLDVQPLLLELSLGAAAETLFGESTVSLSSNAFVTAFNNALQYTARRERLRAFYWLRNNSEFCENCAEVHKVLDAVIEDASQRLSASERTTNEFSALRHVWNKVQDVTAARNELLNLLFAARDTISAAIGWVLYSLAREVEVFLKIQAEIDSVLDSSLSPPTTGELAQMTYLDQVIAETIQLLLSITTHASTALMYTLSVQIDGLGQV